MNRYIMLTKSTDGKRIFANPQNIAFITTHYKKKKKQDITIVQFTGRRNNYIEVIESADTVMKLVDKVTE